MLTNDMGGYLSTSVNYKLLKLLLFRVNEEVFSFFCYTGIIAAGWKKENISLIYVESRSQEDNVCSVHPDRTHSIRNALTKILPCWSQEKAFVLPKELNNFLSFWFLFCSTHTSVVSRRQPSPYYLIWHRAEVVCFLQLFLTFVKAYIDWKGRPMCLIGRRDSQSTF